ncbi:hypothetical protein [Arcobacter sp. FWKO B]|uniref:hypothetical protein n=1 Tax=Arcobacter sp. FWKO B TaxID=2593672 RepID=UPI0018A6534E|nr:hypothetical protein [Arcobacter sp. FWKO B]QOG11210.1 hypothetical protein FWKOB_00250 [Arcobacter sp. FWKO B]
MILDNNTLFLDTPMEYEHYKELLKASKKATQIVVQTNDLHPSIMQLLFCLSREKDIINEDKFNKRLFENLHFRG